MQIVLLLKNGQVQGRPAKIDLKRILEQYVEGDFSCANAADDRFSAATYATSTILRRALWEKAKTPQ